MSTESVTSDSGISAVRMELCKKYDKRYKWAIREGAGDLEGIKEDAFM